MVSTDPTEDAGAPPPPLSQVMKQATRRVHRSSNSLVNAKLVVALADASVYARALGQFQPVFAALEAAYERHCHPQQQQQHEGAAGCAGGDGGSGAGGPRRRTTRTSAAEGTGDAGASTDASVGVPPELGIFADAWAALPRAGSLSRDMAAFLGGDGWAAHVGDTPAVRRYLARVEALSRDDPGLLAAHLYTQYMAMCAGGQIVKRMVLKHLHPPRGKGVDAFEYEGVPPDRIKHQLPRALDDLGTRLSQERRQQLVDEAILVFELNNDIVREFQIGWRGYAAAVWSVLRRLLTMIALALALFAALAWARRNAAHGSILGRVLGGESAGGVAHGGVVGGGGGGGVASGAGAGAAPADVGGGGHVEGHVEL